MLLVLREAALHADLVAPGTGEDQGAPGEAAAAQAQAYSAAYPHAGSYGYSSWYGPYAGQPMLDLGASATLAAPAVAATEEPPAPGMEGAEPPPPGRAAHLALLLLLHGCSAGRLELLLSEACSPWIEGQLQPPGRTALAAVVVAPCCETTTAAKKTLGKREQACLRQDV